ncbi:MAG: hypothetical protein HUU54_00585 [Ignavibacteriaceae bacterium]|nr:hypothetical protein [Ignavibacteriaceae bacterium]
MLKFILSLILFTSIITVPQTKDPDEILDRVKDRFKKVKDYEVDVKIKIDVDFLKVPENKAKILFKQPDKIRIKSDGFALLPKKGLNFSPVSLLSTNFTSFYERDEIIDGNNTAVIKVIPLGESPEIVLSTIWVDRKSFVIRRVESTTKLEGTFNINLAYDQKMISDFPLPSSMIFTFDISKVAIPRGFTGDVSNERQLKKKNRMTKGTVNIYYSDYKINKGISDKEFMEKESVEK